MLRREGAVQLQQRPPELRQQPRGRGESASMAEQRRRGRPVVQRTAQRGRAAQQRERLVQLQRIRGGSRLPERLRTGLPGRPSGRHDHRREVQHRRRRFGADHAEGPPVDPDRGLRRHRKRHRRGDPVAHLHRQQQSPCIPDRRSGQQVGIQDFQSVVFTALVVVASHPERRRRAQRPRRRFRRRPRLGWQPRRSPGFVPGP